MEQKDPGQAGNIIKIEFKKAGLSLSPDELQKFQTLHELLVKSNESGDLTRVHGFRNLILKHYLDGALAAEFIEPQGLTMDLGTGAGFPGLPIAIRRPRWKLLLAEPRGRKLAFMEEAVNLLDLSNIEFFPHKVGPRFDRAIDNFITRDFESAAASLERAAQIIPPGGRVYLMKGPGVDAELKQAAQMAQWAQFETEDDRAYEFDEGRIRRRLITWRKKDQASRPQNRSTQRILEIASRENPRYKNWLKSLNGRGLKKNGLAVVAGKKFIEEILIQFPQSVAGLIARRLDDVADLSISSEQTIYLTRSEIFPALDIFGSGPPLLLVEIPQLPSWDGVLNEGLTVFLPFQDPANLGAAIRSSVALGAKIVLLAEAANPWHPKSLRASGPALLQADLQQGPSLKELAQMNQAGICALSPRGSNILKKSLPEACGFVFGLEGPGLEDIWPLESRLSIPMVQGVESLNAAAAVAVCLGIWAVRKEK